MKHGFIKLGAAVPDVHVAAPMKNAAELCRLIDRAYEEGVHVLTFPELSLTGYTCGDLFLSDDLLDGAERALRTVAEHTAGKKLLVFAGVPLRANDRLYNCAAALSDGEILGVTPKTAVPNYGEFYEARHFAVPAEGETVGIRMGDGIHTFPLSHGVYVCREMPELAVGAEICEELWTTGSASEKLAADGASVIVNLSASNETVGKDEYRRTLVKAASGKCAAAYVYCDAGMGESTTDSVFSGHCMIASNGSILAENEPFGGAELITAVADLQHLRHDRRRMNTWRSAPAVMTASFSLDLRDTDLSGLIDPRPFIPPEGPARDAVCGRIFDIQTAGLIKRIKAARADTCVIGLSGGLDSTLALLVTHEAFRKLGKDPHDLIALTMPCFGTTSRTKSNAERLGSLFKTRFSAVDIKESVDLHFRDIGHDAADHSVVYENAQARERTQILMDIANAENGLVVGTGDLSELALGWATYNGDHMSNYGVNGGIPKTLVRVLVDYYARVHGELSGSPEEGGEAFTLGGVLRDILDTPVSPELLPPKEGEIAQKTEDLVGPYDLHDFFLYHYVRWGESRDKILREAEAAFAGTFDDATIEKWLSTFLRRFRIQQFKRSALPDGPKVGSVALSPRGDWRMPSDAEADV